MDPMMPDMPAAPAQITRELCIPSAALALPDEGEQMLEPSPGDPVQATIEGTVSRIENGHAYITLAAVNGQPIEEAAPVDPMETERASLSAMSQEGY